MFGHRVSKLPQLNSRERNQIRNDSSNPIHVKRSKVWKQYWLGEITVDERIELLAKLRD